MPNPIPGLADFGLGALSIFSTFTKARGEAASYEFKAVQARRNAAAARTAADQTDAFFREELARTVGNIDAIRASAGVDPTSPTSLAIIGRAQDDSDTQRTIRVGNLLSQANQSDADAEYFRYAADRALEAGTYNAVGMGLKSFASLALLAV